MRKLFALTLLILFVSCSKEDTSNQTEFLYYIINDQEDVDQFKATRIHGNLEINGEEVHDLSGLSTLTSVGALVIRNTQLENLYGLHNLTGLNGKVHLENNPILEDVTAISGIGTQIITLKLIDNESLVDLTGLNIAAYADEFHIEGMPVQHLDYFTNVTALNKLRLREMQQLNSIQGLIGLQIIEEELFLEGLSQLNSLEGFNNIDSLDIDLNFIDLHMDDFQGFDGLRTCRSIYISGMSGLQTLSGFDSLESVSGTITITACSGIENFDGFPVLESVGGLIIDNLYALANLGDLPNLSSIENDLVIIENNSLIDLCGIRLLLVNDGLGGTYSVYNNAFNPTQQEVIEGNCSQ
jgi:hypothetical protein